MSNLYHFPADPVEGEPLKQTFVLQLVLVADARSVQDRPIQFSLSMGIYALDVVVRRVDVPMGDVEVKPHPGQMLRAECASVALSQDGSS